MSNPNYDPLQILRPTDLAKLLNCSKATIWRMEKRGELPKRKKISESGRCVGWLRSDIEQFLTSRPFADANTVAEEEG